MTQLTNRQKKIVDFIASRDAVQNQDVVIFLEVDTDSASRETVVRELAVLVDAGIIEKSGKGRAVSYRIRGVHPLLKALDHEEYISKEPDVRSKDAILFNQEIFHKLDGIFSEAEIFELNRKNDAYRGREKNLTPAILRKELERITIELSWKSSKIEGNTYSLIDTEILIKDNKKAYGHDADEATMILNHKKAIDYIFDNREKFKILSLRNVEDVHRMLVEGLEVNHGIRSKAVGITGTQYRPLDNQHQVKEALENTIIEINRMKDPWSKALIALIMIAYIQPFEDGNKRTSRIVANACLIAHDVCPLSLRSIDETEYKKAITVFYELQNAAYMKKLFLEQFDFAIKNYFL
ncbi:MAG: Fic family protein [Patescibacteria group bacterium]